MKLVSSLEHKALVMHANAADCVASLELVSPVLAIDATALADAFHELFLWVADRLKLIPRLILYFTRLGEQCRIHVSSL